MRILIAGANGMLGHKLYQVLGKQHEVFGTIRGTYESIARYGFFDKNRIITDIEAENIDKVTTMIEDFAPDAVVNTIGIVKSLEEKAGVVENIWINALFPHLLYDVCHSKGIRLLQLSTDCVFSGSKGNYSEDDPSDAEDVYGKTKWLGELRHDDALTIRTSMIGMELGNERGLLEWFVSNKGGEVNGYTNAIFTGFPTLHLSGIIGDILEKHGDLNGTYHVSSEPISKHDLLTLINESMKLNIKINKYPDLRSDRSLDSARYRQKTGFTPPAWEQMISELTEDAAQYQNWR